MKTISTTSLEVASHYAAAVKLSPGATPKKPGRASRKRCELDPKFGLGYQGLAVMSRNMGTTAGRREVHREALRYLDEMTERERYATRGYYYIRRPGTISSA